MEDNIYQPPKAHLTTAEPAKAAPIKAVFIASLVDIGGTLTISFIISISYIFIQNSNGISMEQAIQSLEQMDLYAPLSLLGLALGLAITIYAGYLCAKIAQRSVYRVVAVFCIIIMVFGIILTTPYYSALEHILLNLLSLLSAYLGAWLYVRTTTQAR